MGTVVQGRYGYKEGGELLWQEELLLRGTLVELSLKISTIQNLFASMLSDNLALAPPEQTKAPNLCCMQCLRIKRFRRFRESDHS